MRQPWGMTTRKRDTRAILRIVARSERRSPLFHWMVENHDDLIEASRPDGIQWASFCEEAAKRGLTDTRGLPPSMSNARKTWAQARRAVREARAELAARPPKPVYPSRMAKWTPPAILEAIAAGNPAVRGGEPVAHPGANGKREQGFPLSQAPPPPLPPPKPPSDQPLSRYAKPDDPPHVKAALASIEAQLDREDWYLMAGKPRKRRTE